VDDCGSTHRLLDQVDNPHSALWIRLTRNRCHPSTAIQGGRSVSAGWTCEAGHHVYNVRCQVGWQPSRFLTDRAEAERAFALAERLGSVNAAAAELGTTWPSLHKAFTRHGLGRPTRNPEAVRQRAVAAARQRTGRPATPPLDSGVCGAQPWRSPGPPTACRRAVSVRPPRGAIRHLGCQRGGRAEQRKLRPSAHHPGLGGHPPR
jgi:hypothetical protein